jgi:hypothetical protein
VFQDWTVARRCAINTRGYPKAALFGFGTALVAFNALSVAKGALRSVHGAKEVEESVSDSRWAGEVAAVHEGMSIAVPAEAWAGFHQLTPRRLSHALQQLARGGDLSRFPKHKRGPKKPQPKRKSGKRSTHVATARLREARKKVKSTP